MLLLNFSVLVERAHAADLAKGAMRPDRPGIKALALTDNIPLFTAWANDTAYEHIFSEQLENLIEAGDLAIGITDFEDGKLKGLFDIAIVMPNHTMEQKEDSHLLIEYVITTCLRNIN